jgi:hypothetical protein
LGYILLFIHAAALDTALNICLLSAALDICLLDTCLLDICLLDTGSCTHDRASEQRQQ